MITEKGENRMKKWRKVIPVIALALMSAVMTGCAGKNNIPSAPYFTRGVYLNYEADVDNPPMDNFYVFIDETSGHTDDGISGLPFECEQKDGSVKFYMGGPDPESQMIHFPTGSEPCRRLLRTRLICRSKSPLRMSSASICCVKTGTVHE